uniref:Uncharacterized protein n=1 Tax=Anguilla anguilla TaxID=7936 RepID=A0A0E9SYS1_ANGAN
MNPQHLFKLFSVIVRCDCVFHCFFPPSVPVLFSRFCLRVLLLFLFTV